MAELDIISKSDTPNLVNLHRLAYGGSYSSINSELLPKMLLTGTTRYLLKYKNQHIKAKR